MFQFTLNKPFFLVVINNFNHQAPIQGKQYTFHSLIAPIIKYEMSFPVFTILNKLEDATIQQRYRIKSKCVMSQWKPRNNVFLHSLIFSGPSTQLKIINSLKNSHTSSYLHVQNHSIYPLRSESV